MFHRGCYRPGQTRGSRVRGRGARGACGKAVASAGRGMRAWFARGADLPGDRWRDSLASAPFPCSGWAQPLAPRPGSCTWPSGRPTGGRWTRYTRPPWRPGWRCCTPHASDRSVTPATTPSSCATRTATMSRPSTTASLHALRRRCAEFRRFRRPLLAARLDEGLEALNLLWSGEPVTFPGDHVRTDDVVFLPTPVQRPRVPIWVGGVWPPRRPMRRAARWDGAVPILLSGDGGLPPQPDAATVREIHAFLAGCRAAAGLARSHLTWSCRVPPRPGRRLRRTWRDRWARRARPGGPSACGGTWKAPDR